MTCNNTTEYAVIYELEHIVAQMTISSRGKSRRVRNEHIAFYNSRETAEAAMRLFIEDEKKRKRNTVTTVLVINSMSERSSIVRSSTKVPAFHGISILQMAN